MRRIVAGGLALLAVAVVVAYAVLPGIVDRRMNTVVDADPPPASEVARALHRTLFVADLHADQLLWARDPLVRSAHGHVDLPRLQEGNVALQVFSAVTKTPRAMNYDANTGETDNITLLAVAQRWPVATWTSRRARALHQARRLHDAAARSGGALVVVRGRDDLERFVAGRAEQPARVAALLAIEGLHALDGTLESVDTLFAAGYRMMGLTHFFDNEVGASAHGVSKGGLTSLGRDVVRRMEALGVLVDLAHAAPRLVDEVLAMATRPVVVSHTGVAATCPGPRNLTDDQLRAIAATGGVVGIGYWDGAVCEPTEATIVAAIRHAVAVVGAEHVGLGSDFDGATRTPWDTRALARITGALLETEMPEDEIRLVMGESVLRLLRATLPPSGSPPD